MSSPMRHTGYTGPAADYKHQSAGHGREYVRGHIRTENLANFWSPWKRCITGTRIRVSEQPMLRYLDEETFRYHNRKTDDAARFVLVASSVFGKRLAYNRLIGKAPQNATR